MRKRMRRAWRIRAMLRRQQMEAGQHGEDAQATDQIRIDAVLPEDELISMHLSGYFEDDIRRLTRVTTFHCPPWEDERPERTEDQYLGTVELPCGGHVAGWTSEAGLRAMLERFP